MCKQRFSILAVSRLSWEDISSLLPGHPQPTQSAETRPPAEDCNRLQSPHGEVRLASHERESEGALSSQRSTHFKAKNVF